MSTPAPGAEIEIPVGIYFYSKNAGKVTNF